MRKISGLTLIELVLALSLSLLMLSYVYSIFLFSQKIFRRQMGLIHIQENLRTVAGILSHYKMNEKNAYFIAPTERKYDDGTIIYALYKQEHRLKTELVEGVDQIKFLYDFFQEGMLVEKKAEEVVDWSKVKGVSISFLLRNQDLKKRGFIYVAVLPKKPNKVSSHP